MHYIQWCLLSKRLLQQSFFIVTCFNLKSTISSLENAGTRSFLNSQNISYLPFTNTYQKNYRQDRLKCALGLTT